MEIYIIAITLGYVMYLEVLWQFGNYLYFYHLFSFPPFLCTTISYVTQLPASPYSVLYTVCTCSRKVSNEVNYI